MRERQEQSIASLPPDVSFHPAEPPECARKRCPGLSPAQPCGEGQRNALEARFGPGREAFGDRNDPRAHACIVYNQQVAPVQEQKAAAPGDLDTRKKMDQDKWLYQRRAGQYSPVPTTR